MPLPTFLPPSLSSRASRLLAPLAVAAFALGSFSLSGCAAPGGAVTEMVSTNITDSGASGAAGGDADAGQVPPSKEDAGAPAPDDGGATPDGPPVGAAPSYEGSPLCNAEHWMGCYPDDTLPDCSADAGPSGASAGYEHAALGCRVERAATGQGVVPACLPAGLAGDGAPCNEGSDCAAGYECVTGGVCRPYCCDGTCASSHEFCDIESAADMGLSVPVCAPLHTCPLLPSSGDPSACHAPETTCAIVDQEHGTTSCVNVGPQQVGQECETANCGPKLTCVGQPGKRTCFRLCQTAKPGECAAGQTCTGGLPLFPSPTAGLGLCR